MRPIPLPQELANHPYLLALREEFSKLPQTPEEMARAHITCNEHPCNSYAYPINIDRLTFWQRKGIGAIATLHYWPMNFIDKFIMWHTADEPTKRILIRMAREIRKSVGRSEAEEEQ